MSFRDYVFELLSNHGDSTTKQIRDYLPPAGRKDMSVADVQECLEEMEREGLVRRVNRYWRKN
jgi:hypothetical protein